MTNHEEQNKQYEVPRARGSAVFGVILAVVAGGGIAACGGGVTTLEGDPPNPAVEQSAAEPVSDSPAPEPGQEDEFYLNDLEQFYVIQPGASQSLKDAAIDLGHEVCDAYDAGATDDEVLVTIVNGGHGAVDAQIITSAAKRAYCPEHQS